MTHTHRALQGSVGFELTSLQVTSKIKFCVLESTFFVQSYETWQKQLPDKVIIFTKFHKDWTKIVDFLLMANF